MRCCRNSNRFLPGATSFPCPIRGSMREKLSRRSYVVRRPRKPAALSKARGVISLALFAAVAAHAITPPDAAYLQSFEKWKAEMVDDLKQKWLVLAGLFWLKPGANTFGSAEDNAIVVPSGPPHAGSFELKDTDVSVQFQPGTAAKIDDKLVSEAALQSDVTGTPTVIELGSLRMLAITRG